MTTVRPHGWMSPNDELEWGATFEAGWLETDEVIEAASWSVDAQDAAMGLVVEDRGPAADATYGTIAYALVTIAAAERSSSRWDGHGVVVRPRVRIATNRDRVVERAVPIRVARAVSAAQAPRGRVLLIGDLP